jgi:hypothetical protein
MHVPRQVSDDESYRRGVKPGWYAVAPNGVLMSGPFLGHAECTQQIRDPTRAPIEMPLGRQIPQAPVRAASSWHPRRLRVAPLAMLTRAGPFWVIA